MSRSSIRPLFHNTQGIAAVEFGLFLPILMLILVGAVEFTRLAMLHQKLDLAASSMADIVTQGANASATGLNEIAQGMDPIVNPFAFNGGLVFTSIGSFADDPPPPCEAANTPCILWQYTPIPGFESRFGGAGAVPTLPNNYVVANGQNLIGAEVFYNYETFFPFIGRFIPGLAPRVLYHSALYKPRGGTLYAFDPG